MPDGELVVANVDGLQNSGSYNTSSTNSAMRLLLFIVACLILGYTQSDIAGFLRRSSVAGDDSVLPLVPGMASVMTNLGFVVRDVKQHSQLEGISFCSHEWKASGIAVPERKLKTLYKFLSHPPHSPSYPDWFAQLLHELRHDDEWSLWFRCALARVGRAIKSAYGETLESTQSA
jgi:hypothetical protein